MGVSHDVISPPLFFYVDRLFRVILVWYRYLTNFRVIMCFINYVIISSMERVARMELVYRTMLPRVIIM